MRYGLALSVFAWLSAFCTIVLAEGSAEFDLGDAPANGVHDQAVFDGTVIQVDISNSGNEKVCWKGTGGLDLYRPDGTTLVGNVASGSCVNTVPGVTGAYLVELESAQVVGTEWDIRVCASSVSDSDCRTIDTNEQTGRVWSTRWDFQANSSFSSGFSVNGSVYAIVPGGAAGTDAVIEMRMRGVSGAFYKLSANGIGPQTLAGVRVGRSTPTSGHKITPEYKLYLSPPAVARYNWIPPVVSDVQLTSACSGSLVLGTASGTITFSSNITGHYVAVCDVNRDGAFDFAEKTDFSALGNAALGSNTITWDGKTNAGVDAAAGRYSCVIRVNVGEFHYVAEDIETAYPGLRMFRLEADKTTRTAIRMFWDDNAATADAEDMNNVAGQISPNGAVAVGLDTGLYTDPTLPFYFTAGLPAGNARAWGNFDSDGKGNNSFLDQFAAADTVESPAFEIGVVTNDGDADGDGLSNSRECTLGSDPQDSDTDGDRVGDGYEATGSSAKASDSDGTLDILDTDDDGDGITTRTELGAENGDLDPQDAANSDRTGEPDYLDLDSDDDGVADATDLARTNPTACRDADLDFCDDCALTGASGTGPKTSDDGVDTNADGICDASDDDDDGDGVLDGPDTDRTDKTKCRDVDVDGCDDCTRVHVGGGDTADDGTDTDADTLCNTNDPDRDNDGAPNAGDEEPINASICHDLDSDGCDDCGLTGANGSNGSLSGDGADFDRDGLCDIGDSDDDGDGAVDAKDSNDANKNVCSDSDADRCEDCTSGAFAPAADGLDTDTDGLCNAGDPDDDGDGALDDEDSDDANATVCSDEDQDLCDDCARGQLDLANDGPDTELDGQCDAGDPDDDDDGVADADDSNDRNRKVCSDLDSDGCDDCAYGRVNPRKDGRDTDDDGICDSGDDTDGDGVPDVEDFDDDNDGTPDSLEARRNLSADADGDGDGVPNYLDPDDRGDGSANKCPDADGDDRCDSLALLWDEDDDGIANHLDLDADNDGVVDVMEGGFARLDTDGDGLVDGPYGPNGFADALETKPDSGKAKARPLDTNADGTPDMLDLDSDADGVLDIEEVTGLRKLDKNGDGRIDSDRDEDGDGLMSPADDDDASYGYPISAADPRTNDSDGDGIPNAYDADDESAGTGDADGDGLDDEEECSEGWPCQDADGDGTPDYAASDLDGDGEIDGTDLDDDDDGIPDASENSIGVDPGGDHDTDGIQNFRDADDRGDGKGQDCADVPPEDGVCDRLATGFDLDRDGTPNHLDLDTDGDSILDTEESKPGTPDTDSDGVPDFLDLDSDGDGIADSDEAGDKSLQTMARDSDGDGIPDYRDDDDDDDGVLSKLEGGPPQNTDGDKQPDYLDDDDDDDGIPTRDEPGDADRNGTEDRLEEPERPRYAGGAGCTVRSESQSRYASPFAVILLSAFLVLRGRRRQRADQAKRSRHLLTWLLCSALAVLASEARAQVALDQFRPAPLASDGFALSRPDVLREHEWGALAMLDYARNPLVIDMPRAGKELPVVRDQLVLHLGAAFAINGDLTVFAALPTHLVMSGRDPGVFGKDADGTGLGDLALGGRYRLTQADWRRATISAELIVRLPTAQLANSDQTYSGDKVGSYEPALVGETHHGRFDARLRLGFRFRSKVEVGDLELGQEFLYGVGARYRVIANLHAHVELVGLTNFSDFADAQHSPLELLFGAKYTLTDWIMGGAVGPGIVQGYGAPDVRVVLSAGYAPVEKPKPLPPPPPKDSDGDGLLDRDDRCPRDPEDKDSFEDADGCPDPDNDKDLILDAVDKCPLDAEDRDAFEDDNGCPDPDNDQDTVLDGVDKCPLDAEDRDGFEDDNGCPDPDNDQDTVLDGIDACPLVPGEPAANGCPQKRSQIEIENGKLMILKRVEFAVSKDIVLPQSEPLLLEVSALLFNNPQIERLRIEGHTDNAGIDAKNLELSKRRAASVARWLAAHGIEGARLEAWGCGEVAPAATNDTPQGRQENRRVEFHVVVPTPPSPRNVAGCVEAPVSPVE